MVRANPPDMKAILPPLSVLIVLFLPTGCTTPHDAGLSTNPSQNLGMEVGTVVGAGVGAAVAGNPWAGAAIGAGGGLVAGLVVGSIADTWTGSETVTITKYVEETTSDGRVITVPYAMETDRWGRPVGKWKPIAL